MFFQDLETERLYLKNINMEDAEFLLEEFSNVEVNRYLFDQEPMKEIKEAKDLIQFYTQEEPRNCHRWIVVRKSDGTKIGTCGYHYWDQSTNRTEVGWDLLKPYWGNGYMQEAMKAILAFAKNKMNLQYIDAHIYPENISSENLAKRLGFTWNGATVNYEFRGTDYLHHIYTKTLK